MQTQCSDFGWHIRLIEEYMPTSSHFPFVCLHRVTAAPSALNHILSVLVNSNLIDILHIDIYPKLNLGFFL